MTLTYSSYLKLDEMLELQQPVSEGPEHDETLFIIIHQVYELWFKQSLHEVDYLAKLFAEHTSDSDNTPKILHTLRRILTILKTMVAQVDILETMTPMSFNSFRERLDSSSGFQSPQFREMEFVLGHRSRGALRFHEGAARDRLVARLEEPSIYQLFLGFLRTHGYTIPEDVTEPQGDAPPPEHPEVQGELIRIYRDNDRLTQVCERLVDLDEGLQEWRYRHVKMVERTIGDKTGTGGSSGAAYLRSTLFKPIFPDLWTIRSSL